MGKVGVREKDKDHDNTRALTKRHHQNCLIFSSDNFAYFTDIAVMVLLA